MPKTSLRHATTNNKKIKQKSKKKNESQSSSITALIETGDVSMEMSDFEKALTYYSNACDAIRYLIENEKEREISTLLLAKVLGKKGEARVSLGEEDSAMGDFLEGIMLLDGDDSAVMDDDDEDLDVDKKDIDRKGILSDLYLYLAQMRNGEEALMTYQKGVRELKLIADAISAGVDNEDMIDESKEQNEQLLVVTRKKISSVYCSMAELYLTDLCYSPDAEEKCEKLLEHAFENDTDDTSPDALQVMANLRLSQNKSIEAADCMLKVWDRMKVGCTSLSSIVGISLEEDDGNEEDDVAIELQNFDEVNALPNFEFRCQSAKLLFECASILLSPEEQQTPAISDAIANDIPNKCLESSILILGSLLAENDEVIEIWYFLGSAFASLKQDDMAHYYYERTLDMLGKVKEDLERDGGIDDDDEEGQSELQDICERIESVQDKLKCLDVSMEEES